MSNNKEIERKWLIDKKSIPDILIPYSYKNIVQFYTETGVRYRLTEDVDLNIKYYKTEKFGEGLVRVENECEITAEEYDLAMEAQGEHIPITKIRYSIKHYNHVIELDEFDTGECYAEIEFCSEQEALNFNTLPEWFGVEVTNDKHHSNFNIYARMQRRI